MKLVKVAGVVLGIVAALAGAARSAQADTIAYVVPGGTSGNQAFGGALGLDFNVNQPIFVTQIGVFDDGSDGLAQPIGAYLWDRNNTAAPLESMTFTPSDSGALVGGSHLKPLAERRLLTPGFQGSIVAGGYGASERNGNSGGAAPVWTTDDGGGWISFVGGGRNGAVPSQYPTGIDTGPANRYAAGTFAFQPFQIAYQVASGTVGTQTYGGPLGLDFVTNRPLKVEYLGVFDSGQDGLSLPIAATLFARLDQGTAGFGDDKGVPLATVNFSGNDGVLIGGSRFVKLSTPLILPGGFTGTIVAKGYGTGEPNGNSGTPTWQTFSGGGALSFVGTSRFGAVADTFPGTPDGGPANRYATGTFQFADYVLGTGSVSRIAVPNPSFELPGRGDNGFGNNTTSWTPSAGTNAGDYNPPAGTFLEPIPDGDHVAFVGSGWFASAPLGETLQADTLYLLEADWGHRTDSANPRHGMYLRAGGTRLGYVNNLNIFNGPIPASGMFETARGYFTANHNAAIGSALDIELAYGGGGQAIFDNVRLTKITGAAVPLFNPSFELDDVAPGGGFQAGPAGWLQSAAGTGGVFEGAAHIIPSDGMQSAFIFGGNSLTQTVSGVTLDPNGFYVLMVDVADRMNTDLGGYRVELLAGGQPIAVDDNSLGVVQFTTTPGQFYTTSVLELRATGWDQYFGQDLGIRLTALGSGPTIHTYFDNVRLFAMQVPEPSTFALAALGSLLVVAALRRRGGEGTR